MRGLATLQRRSVVQPLTRRGAAVIHLCAKWQQNAQRCNVCSAAALSGTLQLLSAAVRSTTVQLREVVTTMLQRPVAALQCQQQRSTTGGGSRKREICFSYTDHPPTPSTTTGGGRGSRKRDTIMSQRSGVTSHLSTPPRRRVPAACVMQQRCNAGTLSPTPATPRRGAGSSPATLINK